MDKNAIESHLENINLQLEESSDTCTRNQLFMARANLEDRLKNGDYDIHPLGLLDSSAQIELAIGGHGPVQYEMPQEDYLGNPAEELRTSNKQD